MRFDLTDGEARLVRGQIVRHLVELEDEFVRADHGRLKEMIGSEIIVLRGVYDRLARILDGKGTNTSPTQGSA
jgi:hypothetical protein